MGRSYLVQRLYHYPRSQSFSLIEIDQFVLDCLLLSDHLVVLFDFVVFVASVALIAVSRDSQSQ